MLTIDIDTARRFILGKQGLWPGRRWRDIEGAAQAMRAMEYVQLDPLQIIARSHDIALHSRVLDYTPGMWEDLAYRQRRFFNWGGWLAVRPMDELPHWRVVMHRERDSDYGDSRIRRMAHDHAEGIAEMRAILHERDTVTNRDFEMAVLAHLRACADMWGKYIVHILSEDRPTIKAVNPRTWIKKTNYREQQFHPSLQAFSGQRAELLAVLKPLAPDDWSRTATVTGAGKPRERTVYTYAQWLANHEQSHIKQIERIVNTMRT